MKKKNKPDLTTRNLKAQKKREATLKERVEKLERRVKVLVRVVARLLRKNLT